MMENDDQTYTLKLSNQLGELGRLQEALESLPETMDLPPTLVMPLNLAMEEAFTNIVNYAFDDDNPHTIEVSITKHERELVISIVDDGRPYNPTLKEDPDIDLPVEDRKIGGLGIFLIKKIMDDVAYRRENEKNILMLTKKLTQ